VLDAPQLRNNAFARGRAQTRVLDGACVSIDSSGNRISEAERLKKLLEKE
jgi:hypothetical protein